jgi:N-succinyldiaminopimelate aminotransferase
MLRAHTDIREPEWATPALLVSPFVRLRALLGAMPPTREPIDLALGEPRMPVPTWVGDAIAAAGDGFGHYPAISGTARLREAIAGWLHRHQTLAEAIDPDRHILPCCGSREGLFLAILHAVRRYRGPALPAVLFPDPSYPVYAAAGLAAGAEPVPLATTAASAFLPDLDVLARQTGLLARTAALVLGTPANPQGAVADRTYLGRAAALARAHNFILICDECYSEIFVGQRPASALASVDTFDNVLVFNSLSKRSALPGLRSGFCAGDAALIAALSQLRNLVGPQMAVPIQHASALAWADELVVDAVRELHRRRLALADRILGHWCGYSAPAGGFFLWLDIAPWDDVAFTKELWARAGVRVLPGSFLARAPAMAHAAGYVRAALVHDLPTVEIALGAIAALLADSPGALSS